MYEREIHSKQNTLLITVPFSYRTGGASEIEEIYDILKGKLKKSTPFKKYYILVSFAFLQTSV